MSLPAAVPSTLAPRFPPELFTEILCRTDLSKSDLANCCLVSHSFLRLTRPILYATIEFKMKVEPKGLPFLVELDRDGFSMQNVRFLRHTASSKKLFNILEQNPPLGDLVRVIGYSSVECPPNEEETTYRSDSMILEFLDVAPKALNFFFHHSPRAPHQIMRIEDRMTAMRSLESTYNITQYSAGSPGAKVRPLKRLECRIIGWDQSRTNTMAFVGLTVLEVQEVTSDLMDLQAPNLQTLRVPLLESNQVDFRRFQGLEQLRLTLVSEQEEIDNEPEEQEGENGYGEMEENESEEEEDAVESGILGGNGTREGEEMEETDSIEEEEEEEEDEEVEEIEEEEEPFDPIQLSTIPSLRLLAFDVNILPVGFLSAFRGLDRTHLHSRLIRIDFPLLTNVEQVLDLLNPNFPFPAQQIGCSPKIQTRLDEAQKIRDACEVAGVELYWVEIWRVIGRKLGRSPFTSRACSLY